MSRRLVWTRPALKDMKKLAPQHARRVREGLVRLVETGQGDVVKLKDVDPPEWRLRAGDYRAFFQYQPEENAISVLRVKPRGRAY